MKRNINEGVSLMMKDIYLILAIVFFKKASSLCDSTSSEVCKLNYNTELPYVYERHPSIDHSSTTDDTKYCDLHALQHDVWYRSSYNLITECVDHRKCGTSDPIWLNGSLPADTEGTVDGVGCVRTFSSCCESTIALKIRNCTYYMVYCFLDLHSSCHSRFCLDTDLSIETTVAPTTTTIATTTENATTECIIQEVKDCDGSTEYRIPFIVITVIFVISVVAALSVATLWVKSNKNSKVTISTTDLTNGEANKHIANDSRTNIKIDNYNLPPVPEDKNDVSYTSTGDISINVKTHYNS